MERQRSLLLRTYMAVVKFHLYLGLFSFAKHLLALAAGAGGHWEYHTTQSRIAGTRFGTRRFKFGNSTMVFTDGSLGKKLYCFVSDRILFSSFKR